jgi:Tfp pilus assembly protein PilN
MIKINLVAERKAAKGGKAAPGPVVAQGTGGTRNLLLVGIVLLGVLVSAGWWWSLTSQRTRLQQDIRAAEQELVRLEEIRKKADEFKRQKELLERKITLITDLKKKQSVPVHILDQVSRNLPDFLWLDSMTAANNQINIAGKATTYNAVSNFFDNLNASGNFTDVVLGKTSEIPEGVSFSLTCRFAPPQAPEPQAPQG